VHKVETASHYIKGVVAGDRRILSKTITLIESSLAEHQELAAKVLDALADRTGNSVRVGITGVPGVGKSTFIESLGNFLLKRKLRVAILAVDPSSVKSGGSIMGDRTRMERLSADPRAFIRPSPSAGSLGGVARKTRETILVCEAAGFDVVMVETIGVGQSEVTVAAMVDFFLVLLLPGAGDELQGIKRGIIELADAIAVNKADGENIRPAEQASKAYENALHLMTPASTSWQPPVLTCSALTGEGIESVWDTVMSHRRKLIDTGEFFEKRRTQASLWFRFLVDEGLKNWFYQQSGIKELIPHLTRQVESGSVSPMAAASRLLGILPKRRGKYEQS